MDGVGATRNSAFSRPSRLSSADSFVAVDRRQLAPAPGLGALLAQGLGRTDPGQPGVSEMSPGDSPHSRSMAIAF